MDLIHTQSIKTGLLDLPETVLESLSGYVGSTLDISDLQRKEDLDIPILALRETIVNAISHRDYAIMD